MMRKIFTFLFLCFPSALLALPKDFVYLKDIDPTIIQEMRYVGDHNFIGRKIIGYERGVCILHIKAAKALQKVQKDLMARGLSLKVYDCYRPTRAVDDFYRWSKLPKDQKMRAEFYPREDKRLLFDLGYISKQSGHSRGSTVDLTIVDLSKLKQAKYVPGQKLVSCYAPKSLRFQDNSIDMGTGYDCLDILSHIDNLSINQQAQKNRLLLRKVMIQQGFEPFDKEWWHFTLKNEPYKKTYFNFPVR